MGRHCVSAIFPPEPRETETQSEERYSRKSGNSKKVLKVRIPAGGTVKQDPD
ncbi:Hypothetical predicted protein [Xyrichtys novacula]|uniref:Uncharacterized protein n=1 Tax=Xyrichtys novacula TaxID=13765 RepID=A0AAV1HFU5_XYRNO|nr:Hypothetical predicted protein [Xyrichtys novacula]